MIGVPAGMETVGLNKKMKEVGDWGKVMSPQGQELNDTIAHTVRNTLAEALPQIIPMLLPAALGHATKSLEIKPGEAAVSSNIPDLASALDQQAIQKSIERNTAKEAGIQRQGLLPSEPDPEPQAPLLQRVQQPSETSLASLVSNAPGIRTLLKPFKSDLPSRQAKLAEAAQNIPKPPELEDALPGEPPQPPAVSPMEAQQTAEKITGALKEYPQNEQLARSLADTSFERIAGQGPNSYDLSPAEQMRLRQLLAGLPKTPNLEGKVSVSDTPEIQNRQAKYYQQALQAFDSATPADIANPKLRQAYAAESAMNRVAEDVNPAFNPKNAFNYAPTRAEKASLSNEVLNTRKGFLENVPEEMRAAATKDPIRAALDMTQERSPSLTRQDSDAIKQGILDNYDKADKSQVALRAYAQTLKGLDLDPQTQKVLDATVKAMEDKLISGRQVAAEQYLAAVKKQQIQFLYGKTGYAKEYYPDKMAAAREDILKREEAGLPPREKLVGQPGGRPKGVFNRNLEYSEQRQYAKSPALGQRMSVYENFHEGGWDKATSAIADTPLVKDPPIGSDMERVLKEANWVRLSKDPHAGWGKLAGKMVDPALHAEVAPYNLDVWGAGPNSPRGMRELANVIDRWARNVAVGNPAALSANTTGTMWMAAADLGIPPYKFPGILQKGANAFEHPQFGMDARKLPFTTLAGNMKFNPKMLELMKKDPELQRLVGVIEQGNNRVNDPGSDRYLATKGIMDTVDYATQAIRSMLAPVMGKDLSALADPKAIAEAHTTMEALVRRGAYLEMREAGFDHPTAMRRVGEAFLDYTDMSPATKALRKFGFGIGNRFAAYGVGMIGRGMHLATNANPIVAARFWAPLLMVQGWNKMVGDHYVSQGVTPEDQQRRQKELDQFYHLLPTDNKGVNRLGLMLLPPSEQEPGKFRYIDFMRMNPYRPAFGLTTGTMSKVGIPKALGGMGLGHPEPSGAGNDLFSPWIQLPGPVVPFKELAQNRKEYFGNEVVPKGMNYTDPTGMRYVLEQAMGGLMPPQYGSALVNANRAVMSQNENANIQQRRGIQQTPLDTLANATTGMRPGVMDLGVSKGRAAQDFQATINSLARPFNPYSGAAETQQEKKRNLQVGIGRAAKILQSKINPEQ
jgi:hypothetical protein